MREPAGARAVLAVPGFARLWLAGGISSFGDSFTSLALVVLVLRLTHATAAIAGLMLLTTLPQLVLGLGAGVVVDRRDRRRVMILSEALRGLLVLALIGVRSASDLPWLYALALAQAVVGVFFEPARAALLPRVVAPELRLRANALDQTLRLAAGTAGAALAGLLIARPGGIALAFALDGLSFLVSAALLLGLGVAAAPDAAFGAAATTPATPWRVALGEGLRAVRERPALLGLFLTLAVATLALGFMNVSFAPFVLEDLGASPATLGFVRAAQTLGIALGGALVGALGADRHARGMMLAGVIGLGLGFGALATLGQPAALFVLMPLVGLASSALEAGSATLIQRHTPDALRGRIESALDTLLAAVLMGAMAVAGAVAHATGERGLFVIASAANLAGGVVGVLAIPTSVHDPTPEPSEEISVDR